MIDHADARKLVKIAFAKVFGRDATLCEAQCLQAVGALETRYGQGWTEPQAKGSNNIGAIQAGKSWKGDTFEHRDSSPQPDGSSKWYVTKFRKYPSLEAGWVDLVQIMYVDRPLVLAAAHANDPHGVSVELYRSTYYEGTGATEAIRISRHYTSLMKWIVKQCTALNETPAYEIFTERRVLLVKNPFMIGEDVKEVQGEVGAVRDGIYGTETARKVAEVQKEHGLKDDGVVGEQTWKLIDKLQADDATEVETALKTARGRIQIKLV